MLGEWFYNQRIRKATAVFGTLFNNIYVVRKNSAGETISQIKVPLSYAPKRDFVDRIAKMESGENQERQISVKLPRMSFEINAFTYDATRQLPKINKRTIPSTEGASTAQKLYTPVPYTLSFQLHIYGRNQDDCLQIVEQILPYFTPQYNVSIKPLEGFDLQEDTPIKLESVTFSDDFEAALENRRTIIYTLDFDMKITLYKGVPTASGTILDATTNFYNYGTTDLLTSIQCLANQVTGNSDSITEDQGPATGTLKVTNTLNPLYDSDQNVIGNPFSIEAGDSADFGTAIVNSATGEWTYTPNGDFYGTDTFQIGVDVGQGVTEKFTVTVNVTSDDDDAITSNFTVFRNIPTIVDVSTNDTFETLNDVTYTIQTLPNSGGNLSIQDGSAGTFLYTAQSAVSPDFFEYRGLPEAGTAEVGGANVTILDALTYSVSVPNAIEGETINATITTNVANNQTLSWTITGDNTTNGRISTTSGTVVMDATTKQIPIVIGQPAGEQGTVQSTFTITDNSPQYPNTSYGTPPTASDTFNILDTYPPETLTTKDLSGSLVTTPDAYTGFSMASAGDYLIVGSPGEYKAYIRNLSTNTTITLDGDVYAGTSAGNSNVPRRFGHSVATDGTLFAVAGRNTNSGANSVHIFNASGSLLASLDDDINVQNDGFGVGTFFTENYIVVSAPLKAGTGNNPTGIIWAYRKTDYVRFASFQTQTTGMFSARAVYAPKDYVFIGSSTGDTSGNPRGYLCKITASGFEIQQPFYPVDFNGGLYSFQTLNQASSDDLALIFSDVKMTANHIIFGIPGYDGGSLISPEKPVGAIGIWKYAVPDDNHLGLINQFVGSAIRDPANSARITATGLGDLLFPPGANGGDTLWFRVVRDDLGVDIIGRFQYVNSNSINGISTGSMGTSGQSYGWTITPLFVPRNLVTGTNIFQGDDGVATEGTYFGHNIIYDSDAGDIYVSSPYEKFDGETLPSGAIYKLAWGKDNVDSDWQQTVNSITVSGYLKGTNPDGYVWSTSEGETLGAANISDTVSGGISNATTTVGFNLMNVNTYNANDYGVYKPKMLVMGPDGRIIVSSPNSAIDSDGQFVLNAGRVYIGPTFTTTNELPDPLAATFSNVSFLLSTAGGVTVTDASNNGYLVGQVSPNFSVDTPGAAFTDNSLQFSGFSSEIISTASNAVTDIAFAGDFTIEFWLKTVGSATDFPIFRPSSAGSPRYSINVASSGISWDTDDDVATGFTGTTNIVTNQWVFIAISRSSGTTSFWVDGSFEGSFSDSNVYVNDDFKIPGTGVANMNFLLNNLRITEGQALYSGTGDYNVPTGPFPTS